MKGMSNLTTVEVYRANTGNHIDQCRFTTVPMKGDHLIIMGTTYKVLYRVLADGDIYPRVYVTNEV